MPSTITVMNTNDSGPGSLRAAITQADMDTSQDTIDFAPSVTGTITLLSALPDLTGDTLVSGPGASALTVARSAAAGTPDFRIFTVDAGAQVAISGLTITGGLVVGDDGGGIANSGTLTLANATLSGNSASFVVGVASRPRRRHRLQRRHVERSANSTLSDNSAGNFLVNGSIGGRRWHRELGYADSRRLDLQRQLGPRRSTARKRRAASPRRRHRQFGRS